MVRIFDKYHTIGPDYHYRQIDKKSLKNYNAAMDARFRSLARNIRDIVNRRRGKKLSLSNVGCGDGVLIHLLKDITGLELNGVDVSDLALKTAKAKTPVAKPEAAIIISTPVRRTKHPTDPHHIQEFFPEDFTAMMSSHFRGCILHESHNLVATLMYNVPTRSFLNFKYFVNMLSLIFGYNPFLAERRHFSEMFAYMYIVCRK